MKKNQNITVNVGGRPYHILVDRNEEEAVRNASEEINQAIEIYSKEYEYSDMQDLYAMVALQHASGRMRLENEKSFKEKELKDKLIEIDAILTKHLKL